MLISAVGNPRQGDHSVVLSLNNLRKWGSGTGLPKYLGCRNKRLHNLQILVSIYHIIEMALNTPDQQPEGSVAITAFPAGQVPVHWKGI